MKAHVVELNRRLRADPHSAVRPQRLVGEHRPVVLPLELRGCLQQLHNAPTDPERRVNLSHLRHELVDRPAHLEAVVREADEVTGGERARTHPQRTSGDDSTEDEPPEALYDVGGDLLSDGRALRRRECPGARGIVSRRLGVLGTERLDEARRSEALSGERGRLPCGGGGRRRRVAPRRRERATCRADRRRAARNGERERRVDAEAQREAADGIHRGMRHLVEAVVEQLAEGLRVGRQDGGHAALARRGERAQGQPTRTR